MNEKFLSFGNRTDVGRVREKNEDYYGTFETSRGTLFIVCDGMGGHRGGQIASRLTVEIIRSTVINDAEKSSEKLLMNSIMEANIAVYSKASEDSELHGMGTTCVAFLVNPEEPYEGWICHVGDSRIYRIRNGRISQLTRDHSMVWEMVEKGIITREEARNHPRKNVITRAVGIDTEVVPEIRRIDICKGDRYLLCTDGITDLIDDSELMALSSGEDAQQYAEILVETANKKGGIDNSTVQIVDIGDSHEKREASVWPFGTRIKGEFFKDIPVRERAVSVLSTIKNYSNMKSFKSMAGVFLLVVVGFMLLPGEGVDLSSSYQYSESEYSNGQKFYRIEIASDSSNSIKFEEDSVRQISTNTFRISAGVMDCDSCWLRYTIISTEEQERTDSVLIVNSYTPVYRPEITALDDSSGIRILTDPGNTIFYCSIDSVLEEGLFIYRPSPDQIADRIDKAEDGIISFDFPFLITNPTGNMYRNIASFLVSVPSLQLAITAPGGNVIISDSCVIEDYAGDMAGIEITIHGHNTDSTRTGNDGSFRIRVFLEHEGENRFEVIANSRGMLPDSQNLVIPRRVLPSVDVSGVLALDNGTRWLVGLDEITHDEAEELLNDNPVPGEWCFPREEEVRALLGVYIDNSLRMQEKLNITADKILLESLDDDVCIVVFSLEERITWQLLPELRSGTQALYIERQ